MDFANSQQDVDVMQFSVLLSTARLKKHRVPCGRHSRESGIHFQGCIRATWIPAFAGMTPVWVAADVNGSCANFLSDSSGFRRNVDLKTSGVGGYTNITSTPASRSASTISSDALLSVITVFSVDIGVITERLR